MYSISSITKIRNLVIISLLLLLATTGFAA